MRLSHLVLAVCVVAGAAGLAACSNDAHVAAQAPAPASNPDQVVAEIGGRKITLKELDAKWEEFDAAERARVTQLLYQNRRNMLEQLVGDILIENAAKAAGQPVDAFVTQDAAKRAQPVSEAEILQFYEQNKDRAQGRTLDQLRGQIKDFLESQRTGQARAQLIAELKSKGNDVRVLLDPPRYTVAVEDHDPIRGEATAPVTLVEFSDYQ
jgi:protein-disulfide isomerase